VLVLAALMDGTLRFSELRSTVGGVSEKMLAQTLQTLERDGFVYREAHPVIPPHVDYSLTPLGEEARPPGLEPGPVGGKPRPGRDDRPGRVRQGLGTRGAALRAPSTCRCR
jgi:DNA-binding HxlR family transcriptional regulator